MLLRFMAYANNVLSNNSCMNINRKEVHIFGIAFLLSLIAYLYVISFVANEIINLRLSQTFGFLSIIFLFLASVGSTISKKLSNKNLIAYFSSRATFGFCSLYFAILHSTISFFKLLKGFGGIKYLPSIYLIPIILGGIALLIMLILGLLSYKNISQKIPSVKTSAKALSNLLLFVALFHMVSIGSHFRNGHILGISFLFLFIWLIYFKIEDLKSFLEKKDFSNNRIQYIVIGFWIVFLLLLYWFSILLHGSHV